MYNRIAQSNPEVIVSETATSSEIREVAWNLINELTLQGHSGIARGLGKTQRTLILFAWLQQ